MRVIILNTGMLKLKEIFSSPACLELAICHTLSFYYRITQLASFLPLNNNDYCLLYPVALKGAIIIKSGVWENQDLGLAGEKTLRK